MKKGKQKPKPRQSISKASDYGKIDLSKLQHPKREKSKLIHSNKYQVSESIVKTLIDKIITLSVRQSYMNSLNKTFEDYYYNFLFNQLNSLFAVNYLFYYEEPETNKRENIFWNNNYDKENTWIEITEPNSSEVDRYANVFMKYKNFIPPPSPTKEKKNNGINRANTFNEENLKKIKSKTENELIETKIISKSPKKLSVKLNNILIKEGGAMDILEENSSYSGDEDPKEKNNKKKSRKSKSIENPISNIRNSLRQSFTLRKDVSKNSLSKSVSPEKDLFNDDNIIINKNSKKQPILPLKYKDIPESDNDFNLDKFSPPGVDNLRKEFEEEKIRKAKEAKKNAILKKLSNNSDNNNNFYDNLKVIDSNKLTFDSNGNLINFKPIKIEALSRDFLSLKNAIKGENLKKLRFKRKKNNNNSKEIPKIIKEKDKEKEKKPIIKNPEDDPEGKNKYEFVKISTVRSKQIIPGGSSFPIMLPNIGVIVREEDQVKKGSREFGKYFQKYSLNDYDRILKDFLPLQNKTAFKNNIMNSNNSMTQMNLTSGRKKIPKNLPLTQTQNFSNVNNINELTNPLMYPQESIQENDINNNTNLNINNTSSFIKTNKSNITYGLSGNNLYSLSRFNNASNYSEAGIIRLNKNCSTSSLKNEIENMKDLDSESFINFYPTKGKLNTRNIFHNNYKEFIKNKKGSREYDPNIGKKMNELNKKIIKAGTWGTQTLQKNNSTGNLLFSKHLTKYQALRELGSNILNGIKVKLPRGRKVDLNIK